MSGDVESERIEWIFAPVFCAVLLTAGAIAGVVRALRYGGLDQCCGGIPVPRCRWLTSRWAVRLAAWFALTAGVADLMIAARCFMEGWDGHVPPNLLSLVLVTYALLGASPVIAVVGLKWRDVPAVHGAFSQIVKIALLGGLAAGLASEVLCESGEEERVVTEPWRKGCATLGASAGLLLLGLYGMQADIQEDAVPTVQVTTVPDMEDEEAGQNSMGPRFTRPRWPSWRHVMPDFDFPTIRIPSLGASSDLPPLHRQGTGGPDFPEIRRPPAVSEADFRQMPPQGLGSSDFPHAGQGAGLRAPLLAPPELGAPSARARQELPPLGLATRLPAETHPASVKARPANTPSTCASPLGCGADEQDVDRQSSAQDLGAERKTSQAWRTSSSSSSLAAFTDYSRQLLLEAPAAISTP